MYNKLVQLGMRIHNSVNSEYNTKISILIKDEKIVIMTTLAPKDIPKNATDFKAAQSVDFEKNVSTTIQQKLSLGAKL